MKRILRPFILILFSLHKTLLWVSQGKIGIIEKGFLILPLIWNFFFIKVGLQLIGRYLNRRKWKMSLHGNCTWSQDKWKSGFKTEEQGIKSDIISQINYEMIPKMISLADFISKFLGPSWSRQKLIVSSWSGGVRA